MFDFGHANKFQKEAISCVDKPLLIIAGPGTGKTYTLVQRTVYMIQEKGVKPEQIMLATFTEKAAKELITRITNELISRGISVNLNEMYIGTFHSICLRIIKEYIEFSDVRKNFKVIDSFEQQYIVFQNINRFRKIEGFDILIGQGGAWRQSEKICKYVNNLSEELVDPQDLKKDSDKSISTLGRILECYNQVIYDMNVLDFSSIQTKAYYLLKNNKDILNEIKDKIKYIMVDEYQDTNYIQEQLVFMISGKQKNICVVGDDDQGLYRFRGATIRNILEFPDKFKKGECKIVKLIINYRSNKQIVDFYNNWMDDYYTKEHGFEWGRYRFNKNIKPYKNDTLKTATVIKVSSDKSEEDWFKEVLDFINYLLDSKKLTNLNQIAFLFKSVKNERVIKLANYLEKNNINVYSPRSNMFFERDEIKLIIGIMILIFPNYLNDLNEDNFQYISEPLSEYYIKCVEYTLNKLEDKNYSNLLKWIKKKMKIHSNLQKNTDYGFTGLVYQMLQFEPLKGYMDVDLNESVNDLRSARNISILTDIFSKYEYLHNVNVFTSKNIDNVVEKFFNMYLKFLYQGGISEYEDDSEYAPSNCVSFLTIHQSKGMEFPVVLVGSLYSRPENRTDIISEKIQEKYFKRPIFEPEEYIKYFDFWRLYYTAFSRAQNILVLTCSEKKSGSWKRPSAYFKEIYDELPDYKDKKFDINKLNLNTVKNVDIKETYSFTSHISVYENCSLQYKFFKELGFTPVRVGSTIFGTLVHQTIEDIHKAAIRKEESLINSENVEQWFYDNYESISKSQHTYLGEEQLKSAYDQVMRYVEQKNGNWDNIQDAEVNVELVKENYILQGKIDLIEGNGDTIEIIDFKSEKKPDLVKDKDKINYYKKQLQVYAYLVEQKMGKKVKKIHLYYTGEKKEPIITFNKSKSSIKKTINEFDSIVNKIQNKDFEHKSNSKQVCSNCDFRFYCGKRK